MLQNQVLNRPDGLKHAKRRWIHGHSADPFLLAGGNRQEDERRDGAGEWGQRRTASSRCRGDGLRQRRHDQLVLPSRHGGSPWQAYRQQDFEQFRQKVLQEGQMNR